MEIVIAVALFIGIVVGVAWAIAGTTNARLRRALSYQSDAAAALRDERDLLQRTLKLHDRALEDRDAKLAEANARAALSERNAAPCYQGELAADTEVARLQAELAGRDDMIDRLQLQVADLRRKASGPVSDGEDLGDVSDAAPAGVVPAAAVAGNDDCSAMIVAERAP